MLPDSNGHFGVLAVVLSRKRTVFALEELATAYERYREDPALPGVSRFMRQLLGRLTLCITQSDYRRNWGRRSCSKVRSNHTGAHKINNAPSQMLPAKRMGKRRLIAETGAGQHGVATATGCFGGHERHLYGRG